MAQAFYGSKISQNIIQTPEGFIICKNVPVARTGVQKYLGKELGLDDRYDEVIKVYREEDEVFSPRTVASFEGKCLTDEHPCEWVSPDNCLNYAKGTVINVRRGSGKDSDLLLADIIVHSRNQINDISNKNKREISCGYECEYEPYKDGFLQKNIIGNHIALTSAGRAGSRVAIKDTKTSVKEGRKSKMAEFRLPRKGKIADTLKAIGLKTIAQDAEPEDIMDAVDELVNEKYQAERDAEPVIIEKESETSAVDPEKEQIKSEISEIKDSIRAMLARDQEMEKEEETGMESLDAFEEEVAKMAGDEDEMEQVAALEEDPDVINEMGDECMETEEASETMDSILEMAKALRPTIAAIPDAKQRKKAADDLSKVLRNHAKKAKDSKKSEYSKLIGAKDSASMQIDQQDLGRLIAEQNNPHYKK